VWTGYSTSQVADLIGLSEAVIRSVARAGLLSPKPRGQPLVFSFRDVAVLRIIKSLTTQGIPLRRIRRQLTALKRQLPDDRSLASVSLVARGGHVVVRDRERPWRVDNGQLLFAFEADDQTPTGDVEPMPLRRDAPGPEPIPGPSADEWFERALLIEEDDPDAAMAAYRRALTLQPDCVETLINLGRLYAETGETEAATACFRQALEIDPNDPTAVYNLGVVSQDAGRDDEAIQCYRKALALDPGLAEAHYNLATVFDRAGEPQAAIRHINEYRKLVKKPQ
jgi:DNA-binding transcriptional MerR regulator